MGDSNSQAAPGRPAFAVAPAPWTRTRDALLTVRVAVFVREQGVPAELEPDAWDARAEHFIARDATGTPIGTARLLPDAHIGRLAVLPAWRGRGVGRALLDAAVARAAQRGMREVVLHAQVQARGFYERAGFVAMGGEFQEAGIAHLRMVRALGPGGAPA